MKFIKWRILIVTCAVCLLPILPGLVLWDKLPDTMAIHFNVYNEPDNFASKAFVVFGLPALMTFLQIFCCFINDINASKHGERKKFESATKWIIPVMSVLLQSITFCYGLGMNVDIRRAVVLIVGCVLLVVGNYLPKFDYVKNYDVDTEKARKINRFIGRMTVVVGILAIVTIFLPPLATAIWLVMLIPYAIISAVYTVKEIRK